MPLSLTEAERLRLADIAAAHELDLVLLFGSVATGREHAGSDLDIAVRYRASVPGLDAQAELKILAYKRYQDFRPRLEHERRYVRRFLAERGRAE